jgi:hypothetical protein
LRIVSFVLVYYYFSSKNVIAERPNRQQKD